ncbi:MAG: S8 family serine peptidase, partial [Phycisphaerae bacterium]|nr:S8 family serine peptidase [Phycisphaerae bacterium]
MKFLSDGGSGSTSGAIGAINYVTMMKRDYGVNVVATNNSWGGGGYSQALSDAIAAGGAEGVLFIAAAGNSGNNTDIYA